MFLLLYLANAKLTLFLQKEQPIVTPPIGDLPPIVLTPVTWTPTESPVSQTDTPAEGMNVPGRAFSENFLFWLLTFSQRWSW